MQINKERNEDNLTWRLSGRLDTVTAPELQKAVDAELAGIKKLTIDMEALEYITSAGLRVLLLAAKKLDDAKGMFVIRNISKGVREVFKITGFDKILHVQ